jgi:hypothetical protein
MSTHAPFPPSSAKRWMTCPGSFGLSLQLPDPPDSVYSAEGTRLHDVAAAHLLGTERASDADWAFLAPYTDHCVDLIARAEGYTVETRIEHSPVLSGTADFMARLDDTLHVVDLKTGAGVMVEPERNEQLMIYGYMAVEAYARNEPAAHAARPIKQITMTIVQPPDTERPVKSWTANVYEVLAFGVQAEEAIQKALGGSTELVPGEHCRWCKAKPVCPRLTGMLAALPSSMHIGELGALATAEVLDRADLVLQFIDAVREHGHSLASRGINVPGWTLKPKRSMRSWADEDKVLEIARRRKIKIWQDKLMSPAMAEKAHPNMPAELTEQIVSVSSGTNLVRGNSPAPVALPSGASTIERLMANFETLKYRK